MTITTFSLCTVALTLLQHSAPNDEEPSSFKPEEEEEEAHFSTSSPFLITAAEEMLRHLLLCEVLTRCGCCVIVLLLFERHAGGSSSEAKGGGGRENHPQLDSSSLAVSQLFKVLRDKRKLSLCSGAAGLVFKVPKGDKLFLLAVSTAGCRCCADSFKRRKIKSDGRGRSNRQLEATMILSSSSRGKTDSEW